MIVVFNKFSVLLIGLFLVLLTLKLTIYPSLLWSLVGFPIYGPPVISLTVALYQLNKFNRYKRAFFEELDI